MAKKAVVQNNIQIVLKTMICPPPETKLAVETVTDIEGWLSKFSDDLYNFEDAEEELDRLRERYLADKKHLKMVQAGFRKLDYSFLSWCNKDRLPAFVILSLSSKNFEVTVEPRNSPVDNINDVEVAMNPRLDQVLFDQFNEAFITLGRLSNEKFDSKALTITAKFQGFVPAETRKLIDRVYYDQGVFDAVYIICDAPTDWRPEQTSQISMKDPLVVGWDGENNTMYLVTTFDPITLEEYILASS